MAEIVYKSKCCNAEVKADGTSDFLGSKEVCTMSFVCFECNKPCDTAMPKNRKQKTCAAEKPVMMELNVDDYIEIRLTKEGRKIYNEYRKKYRYNPLKKVIGSWFSMPLNEFMFIFGPRINTNSAIVDNIIRIRTPKP